MKHEFERIAANECVLCGATANLTGEHKIKASLIRGEFGDRATVLAGKDRPKLAQSPKSKIFHFKARLCQTCNSSSTQAGDEAFDLLHECLRKRYDEGLELTDASHRPICIFPDNVSVDYFRYFSKILCCFLAEVGGPRSRSLTSFSLGGSSLNPIFLSISTDENYEAIRETFGTQGFAEHGGLKFRFDDRVRWVKAIESSISVGGIRYNFWVQLRWRATLELHLRYSNLIQLAKQNIVQN